MSYPNTTTEYWENNSQEPDLDLLEEERDNSRDEDDAVDLKIDKWKEERLCEK